MTVPRYAPVTPEEAARNAAVLLHELGEYERGRRARAIEDRGAAPLAYLSARRPAPPESAAAIVQLREAGPEAADLSAGTGLTPRQRSALMGRAKSRAIEFAIAVRSRSAHAVQRQSAAMTAADWRALAITYAEVADPSRLLAVVQAQDDGMPVHVHQGDHFHAA